MRRTYYELRKSSIIHKSLATNPQKTFRLSKRLKLFGVDIVASLNVNDFIFCPTPLGETPHHCQICGKKYTRKEHLANHMRSHTNDSPFQCELCSKSFTRKEHFSNHILWHTGQYPTLPKGVEPLKAHIAILGAYSTNYAEKLAIAMMILRELRLVHETA